MAFCDDYFLPPLTAVPPLRLIPSQSSQDGGGKAKYNKRFELYNIIQIALTIRQIAIGTR